VWLTGVLLAIFCVHPAFYLWSETQARIRDVIVEKTDPEAVLITNYMATRKFLNELERKYRPVDSRQISIGSANALIDRYQEVYVAFVDRSDSSWWRNDANLNAEFIEGLDEEPLLLADERMSPTDRVRIWRITRR
jgi:hypothetical protein